MQYARTGSHYTNPESAGQALAYPFLWLLEHIHLIEKIGVFVCLLFTICSLGSLAFESLTPFLGLWNGAKFLMARLLFNQNDFVITYLCLWIYRPSQVVWIFWKNSWLSICLQNWCGMEIRNEMWCNMVSFSWVIRSACPKYWLGRTFGKTALFLRLLFPHM